MRFFLDGELVELSAVDPTRTVLQFLREDLHRTGTKEGCAEGDCGACTVALIELDETGRNLRTRAVNACILFLPSIDGKELVTVESLLGEGGDLHPVQQALVDVHGSQCGFCTPGFVVSLFALYKNNPSPTRKDIDEALSGNLCRCTGYAPIVEAAEAMYRYPTPGDDWLRRAAYGNDAARIERLQGIQREDTLVTGLDDRRFYAPRSLGELIALKRQYPEATLIAGGTDVGLWVTKQYRRPEVLILTSRVPELLRTRISDGLVEIGAAVTLRDAVPLITEHYPQLGQLFARFASPPIRNVATLGGNIANGSPIGDSMPPLMALGARVVLQGPSGQRELPLEDFYLDYMVTALTDDEVLASIKIPLPADAGTIRCYKVSKRFDQDISALCLAFYLELEDGVVVSARIGAGGMAAIPKRARRCEAAITGQPWDEAAVEAGMRALAKDFTPIDDFRASAEYRMRCAQNLFRRCYLETTRRKDYSVYDHGR
ncbi:MAG: xanthine dehydrogenase small subunit [Lysobacterales bacterium]